MTELPTREMSRAFLGTGDIRRTQMAAARSKSSLRQLRTKPSVGKWCFVVTAYDSQETRVANGRLTPALLSQ